MDVIDDLLRPKFPAGCKIDERKWNDQVISLVDAFMRKRGLHQDELDNYNSYLPELIVMLKEHVRPVYKDKNDQLHMIEIVEAHFVLPYEEKVGIDSAERALMRGNYECEVHGVVRYSVRRKRDALPIPTAQEEVVSTEEQDLKSSAAKPDQEEGNEDEEDEEEEEEEDDEEDEEEKEEEEDEEEEEKDDEEEKEDGEDDQEEEEEPSSGDDEEEDANPETEKKKTLAKNLSDKDATFGELIPTVGMSRNIDLTRGKSAKAEKPAFLIEKDDYSEYSVIVYETYERHMCLEFPPWLRSKLCWISTPLREPFLMTKPYLIGCSYLVSRSMKLCPYEEYYHNNRNLQLKQNRVEIRCKFYHASKRFRTNCTLRFSIEYTKFRKNHNNSWFRPPRFVMDIPHETPRAYCSVTILAMAYGWSIRDFIDAIRMYLRYTNTPEVESMLTIIGLDTDGCKTQKDAIQRISKFLSKCRTMAVPEQIASYVSFTLRGEFLPNLVDMEGDDKCDHTVENLRKGYAIAEAVSELIQMSDPVNEQRDPKERWAPVDKRAYNVKRIDTPGEKIIFLSRKYIKHLQQKSTRNLENAVVSGRSIDLSAVLNHKMIKLTTSVKNGVWDSKSDASESNQNKTQMMITGYCSDALHSQVAKIIKFAMKKNSNPDPLLTHPTQTGRVDLYLTPESERCGIVRNKSLGCWITPLINHVNMMYVIRRLISKYADEFGWEPLGSVCKFPAKTMTMVKDIYGGLMGWVAHPYKLYTRFVGLRRRCALWPFLGLEWDRQRDVFYFCSDEGRLCRPLIILERFRDLMTLMDGVAFLCHPDPVQYLLEQGVIEYIDASEEYCGLAFTAESLEDALKTGCTQTHMEVHGLFSVSVTVAKAFCNFNAGPRRMYTGNMEKRSIGLKLFEDRGTTVSYSIWYGQSPLVSDPITQSLGSRYKEPNGINTCVAVISHKNNIEDSYLCKKEAVERGFGISSETMVTISALGSNCVFQRPDGKTKGCAADGKYAAIQPDGTPRLRADLAGGDAVIGKTFYKKEGGEIKRRDISKFLPWNENFTVKSVSRYPPGADKPARIIRVSLSKTNIPTAGDKFFYAHGQKGTISRLVPAYDMPFFEYGRMAGQSPDIVINVASFARVTMGFLLEIMWSKAAAYNASRMHQFHTAFMGAKSFDEQERICNAVLVAAGLSYRGKERMRMGQTGEMIECAIYNGFAYTHVLKHMARDKLRSRDRGPINEMTRAPTTGKRASGGLRAISGEHENINTCSYGMSRVFSDVNWQSADKFTSYWCTKCHAQAVGCQDSDLYHCLMCKSSADIVRLPVTYITNLIFEELYGAGLGHSIVSEKLPAGEVVVDEDSIFQRTRALRIKN